MKNERRIKVDFPDVDLTTSDISTEYIKAGKTIIEEGQMKSLDGFLNSLERVQSPPVPAHGQDEGPVQIHGEYGRQRLGRVNGLSSFF
jgi:hypothetical protein